MSQPHPCDGCQHDATCVDGRHCLPYKVWAVNHISELHDEIRTLALDGGIEVTQRLIAIGKECLQIDARLSGKKEV